MVISPVYRGYITVINKVTSCMLRPEGKEVGEEKGTERKGHSKGRNWEEGKTYVRAGKV